MKFFSGKEKEKKSLKFYDMKNVGVFSKSREEFIDCPASEYSNIALMKNKLKFHLETGKIYQDNINTYLKKFIRRDMNLNDDFESYVR